MTTSILGIPYYSVTKIHSTAGKNYITKSSSPHLYYGHIPQRLIVPK